MIELEFDLGRGSNGCTESCDEFLDYWEDFWRQQSDPSMPPVAVIACQGYLDSLHKNARKLARRGERRYQLREFNINEHCADVQQVNQSKLATTQGPTYGWFRKPVLQRELPELCDIHRETWYGAFDDQNVLRGYWSIIRLNNLGTSRWLFRHAEHSNYTLNGLIAYIAEHAGVDYVTYHTMNAESHTGRPEFKRRIGCQEARLRFITTSERKRDEIPTV